MIHDLKPYLAYKDSGVPWLREVPEHWEIQNLKHLTHFYNGLAFKPSDWKDTGVPIIRIQNLNGSEEFNYTTRQDLPKFLLIHPGDLLFSWSGNRGTSFGPFIWRRQFEGYLNQHIFKLDGYKFDIHYFAHLLRAVTKHIEDQTHGIIGLVHITKPELGAVCVPVAPPAEQSTIVRYLDYIDRRIRRYIRTKQKLIKLLEEQKQAIIHQAVTRGLDPNVKLKPSGVEWLGDVPEHWDTMKVSRIFRVIGSGTTPSTGNQAYYKEGKVPWVITGDLKNRELNGTSRNVTETALQNYSTLKMYPSGSIVVAMYGATIGKVGLLRIEACVNQACCILAKSPFLIPEYALHMFIGLRDEIIRLGVGGGQPNISQQIIRQLRLPVPPIEEQKFILDLLHEGTLRLDQTIDRAHREISLLREYRTRLLADVVTGKLDVREAAANLPEELNETEVLDEELVEDEESTEENLESEPEE